MNRDQSSGSAFWIILGVGILFLYLGLGGQGLFSKLGLMAAGLLTAKSALVPTPSGTPSESSPASEPAPAEPIPTEIPLEVPVP